MSELEEIKIATTDKVLVPSKRLSPTSVNSFYKCPREFYYTYVEKLKTKPNIHLVKGSIVHKVLENFFRGFQANAKTWLKEDFRKEWIKNDVLIKSLELPKDELMLHKKDAFRMIMDFYELHSRKVKALVENQKAENEQHAFFLVKPRMREMFVEDEELHCAGYIDRVHVDYNNIMTLGDYKTSSKFGIGLPEDYKRQLSIYALLYYRNKKVMPDFVAIIFLRYGEEFLLEVTPSLLSYARDSIGYVWDRTRSSNIEDYPLKQGSLCRWCQYFPVCSKEAEFKSKVRVEKIKEMIKDDTKETA